MLIFTYGVLKTTKTRIRLIYCVLHACTMILKLYNVFHEIHFFYFKKNFAREITFWIFQCFFSHFFKKFTCELQNEKRIISRFKSYCACANYRLLATCSKIESTIYIFVIEKYQK